MIRAIGVELWRLRSRRAVGILLLVAIAAALLVLGMAVKDAIPPSAAERAAAQQQVDAMLADPSYQQQVADCQASQQAGDGSFPADMDCEQDMRPQPEWFLGWSPPDYLANLNELTLRIVPAMALAVAIVGITFAGADYSAATIGTQLLFQPRRGRVFTAKGLAVVLLGAVVGAIAVALVVAVAYWTASRWGTTALVEPDPVDGHPLTVSGGEVVARALRAWIAVAAAGLGGFALAVLMRSSLGALGVVAGYLLVGEGLLRGTVGSAVEPWLLSTRLLAFLQGHYEVFGSGSCGPEGCQQVVIRIGLWPSVAYLVVLLSVLVGTALVLFRRRDVT